MDSALTETRRYAGEFLACFFYLFSVQGASYAASQTDEAGLVSAVAAFCAGIVSVTVFGSLSGAHFNPAVTLGVMIGGRMPVGRGVLYIVFQVGAGILATLLLGFLYPEKFTVVAKKLVIAVPENSYWWPALMMEVAMTFLLVFVVYAVAVGLPNELERRSGRTGGIIKSGPGIPTEEEIVKKNNKAAIAIGLTLGLLNLVGSLSSGGAFNPARATGPAIVGTEFSSLWIYWAGGVIGPFLAALLWKTLFF